MPQIKEVIDQMSAEEKFSTMDYIWASLSTGSEQLMPAWHLRELRATEERVATGVECPIPWNAAKKILQGAN